MRGPQVSEALHLGSKPLVAFALLTVVLGYLAVCVANLDVLLQCCGIHKFSVTKLTQHLTVHIKVDLKTSFSTANLFAYRANIPTYRVPIRANVCLACRFGLHRLLWLRLLFGLVIFTRLSLLHLWLVSRDGAACSHRLYLWWW